MGSPTITAEEVSQSSNDVTCVNIEVGLPGLVAEQLFFYKSKLHHKLKSLTNRLDLSSLGGIKITMFYANAIAKLGLNTSSKSGGHIAASYVTYGEAGDKPAASHIVLKFESMSGLWDPKSDDHDWCMQVLASCIGDATTSFTFDQRCGKYWNGGPYMRWNEISRDCFLAFESSNLTSGIGFDAEDALFAQQSKAAAEVKAACAAWIEACQKPDVDPDYGDIAWDLSEAYSAWFVSMARLLGVRYAKCKSSNSDVAYGMATSLPGWFQRLEQTLICISRKWMNNEDAEAELVSLADLLLQVTLADVQERYPEVYDDMADSMTSDAWPAKFLWPLPKPRG